MTNENECKGTYSVSGYTRNDGTEVSGYTRTCGAAHNSNSSSSTSTSTQKNDDEEKMKQRAELLYPTMKNKKQEKDNMKSGRAQILEELGLNSEDYELSGNEISVKNKVKNQKIDGIIYPLGTNIEAVERMRIDAKNRFSERYKLENDKFLKWNAKIEQVGVDNSENWIIKNIASFGYGKESVENLLMSKTDSYLDTDYAKKNTIFKNYNEAPRVLQKYFKNKITEQIGKDKLGTTKGLLIDEHSESSQSLKQNLISDDKFLDKLKTYYKALKYGYSINDSISLKGCNWHNAVGNADIRNMHINKNGDIELFIADVYDFNVGEDNKFVRIGYDRQAKGKITPYFYAYRIIIKK